MFKHKAVVIVALFAAIIAVVFALLFHWMHFTNNINLYLSLVVLFALTFGVIVYLLNRNIYSRLDTLYKLMYASGDKKLSDKNVNIGRVEKEVIKWSQEKEPIIRQLKAQEKFRREFIGDVAHELKTPIFNIQGYIFTLIDGGLYDETINKKYLRKAQKNINRMIHMVQDLDLITKIESGTLVLTKKRFLLSLVIEEAIDEVEMRALEKDIKIRYQKPKEDIWVIAEKNHILRVLINLISNSLKYGKKGGKTEISIKHKKASNKYWIKVEDNGIGIKKEDMPRIFERFYRVDKSRSRNEGGSGLGLAIVKHILEAHNETISVKSTFGEGTSFQFSLEKALK
ncbi:two-component system phosphate regulon sensor histidine kinase PhoR [Balneicella halophila]|uniref:histidine kinase n=1 Tax=Balneicella halophila TaxID=1537566 RepID=A0A7L4UQM5_BALHA|nr:ATP-binding protein [Balneicella halophila]PVX52053.1 two-component system phosphate regulon sensor histidine kinase PhoR [Balneicella halophila]